MLSKLIKHNLKPIFKSILPLIVALTASIILFSVTAYDIEFQVGESTTVEIIHASDFQVFLHGFANFAISCSLILLFAFAIKAIWHRFRINFYSDETYLTHTLPISRRTLWKAQVLSALIVFVSVLVIVALNFLILFLTRPGQQFLESLGLIGGCSRCYGEYYYIELLSPAFYLSLIFVILAEFMFLAFCGMFGLILSNHLGKNRALLFGIGIYMLGNILLLGLVFLIGNFDSDLLKIFEQSQTIGTPESTLGLSFAARALTYIGTIYTCYNLALYFVNQKLLNRGINLE